jgi:hypothetical protein
MQEKQNVVVTSTLPVDVHQKVEARAAALHISKASVIRHAVCEFFADGGKRHGS